MSSCSCPVFDTLDDFCLTNSSFAVSEACIHWSLKFVTRMNIIMNIIQSENLMSQSKQKSQKNAIVLSGLIFFEVCALDLRKSIRKGVLCGMEWILWRDIISFLLLTSSRKVLRLILWSHYKIYMLCLLSLYYSMPFFFSAVRPGSVTASFRFDTPSSNSTNLIVTYIAPKPKSMLYTLVVVCGNKTYEVSSCNRMSAWC